jgi:hypothetical protein
MSDAPETCKSCGQAVTPGARFCGGCGHSLTDSATIPPGSFPPPTAQQAPLLGHEAPSFGLPAPAVYGPPSYSYPQYLPPPTSSKTNGMAIASLVLGILWLWGLGSLLALIFGVIGKNQIDKSGGLESGRGMAIAGIVLGIVGLAGAVLFTILLIASANSVNTGY